MTRIGYFADGPWSHQALQKFIADPTIRLVFITARFDRPDPILREQSEKHRIKFLTHASVNSEDFIQQIASHDCDLFVSMSFNQIFRRRLSELPPLHTINCHAGKLPFYRGRNILNWVLINDEREFGITVHYVDEGIDTGDILAQRTFPITDQDDYATLLQRAYSGCAELLYETVKRLQAGQMVRTPQSAIHPRGFYCVARREGDEVLNWNQPARNVFNFVRALCYPGPQAKTTLLGTEVRINRVEWLPDAPMFKGITGAVLGSDADGVLVKTLDSFVRVVEWSGVPRLRIGHRFT